MSVSVQQIIEDAKNLAFKLKKRGETADRLMDQADAVHLQLKAMKQYADNVAALNKVTGHRPRELLVEGIERESRYFISLQQENIEIRAALEEQQNALEFIVSKYRQHVDALTNSKVDLKETLNKCVVNPTLNQTNMIASQTEKMREMRAVMARAAQIDNDDGLKQQHAELSRLRAENKRLRCLLGFPTKTSVNLHDSD